MRLKPPLIAALLALGPLSAGGCATRPPSASPEPSYAPIVGQAPSPHARLYAECLAQSAGSQRFDMVTDKSSRLIRFKCSGDPARALYDELAVWSGERGSRWTRDGRQGRSPQRIKRDLFGVDFCTTSDSGDYSCEIILNVGEFLIP